jgi:hypothetical protein
VGIKIPPDASPEIRAAFRELEDRLNELERRDRTLDLKGGRIGGAGVPVQSHDLATKGYIDSVIRKALDGINVGVKKLVTSIAGGVPTVGGNIDFGYYRVDTLQSGGGQEGNTVKAWTNTVYVGPVDGGTSTTPPSDRDANFRAILARLAALGFNFVIDVEMGTTLTQGAVLQAAQPYWDKVKYVVLGDELNPSTTPIDAEATALRNRIRNLGLAAKPVGVVFTPIQVLSGNVGALNLDFVGLEAYTDQCSCSSCGNTSPEAEVQAGVDQMNRMKALIPATKIIMVVMQAYDRNGAFTATPSLIELNRATYFKMVKGDSRVKALMMFAYVRRGNQCNTGSQYGFGTIGYPQLAAVHQEIWKDMTGGATTGGAKKCIGDNRNCPGGPTCCDGGESNPCNCPRLCEGGAYANMVEAATQATVSSHPELFSGGFFLSEAAALQYRAFLVAEFNRANTSLKAIIDPNEGKQILARRRDAAEFREDYRVWNSNLTVAHAPGAYRASCWGEDLSW